MPKIKHLVIPGGGPNGFQFIGALQHLEKNGVWNINEIESIYATSVGAILSLLIAMKFDWEYIIDYLVKRPWHETYTINVQIIFDAFSKKGLFDNKAVETFYKPFFNAKDLSLEMTMREFYEYSKIELHFFSLEINSFQITDISFKNYPDIPVLQAVQMSCAIPLIFSPVCFDKKCFVDGGIVTNYPLMNCLEEHPEKDEILGIRCIYKKEDENNIVNEESTILDYVIYFIGKLINNAHSKIKYDDLITNELVFHNVKTGSISFFKEALISQEVRNRMIEDGIKIAEEYILHITLQKNAVHNLHV